MIRKQFRLAWVMGITLLVAGACGGGGGGGSSSSSSSGGSGGGGSSYDQSACGLCVKEACAAEIDACAGDPGCAAYLTCLNVCGLDATGNADPACADACPTPDNSTSQAARTALEECRWHGDGATQCAACGVTIYAHPLLNQDCPASMDPNACFACEDTHCCETYAACEANAECDVLVQCLQACPVSDDACWSQCLADHPTGIADLGARLGCVLIYCGEQGLCNDNPLSSCERCVNTRCGDLFMTCWSDAECYLLSDCAASCPTGDGACIDGCVAAHPAGEQKFNDYSVCSTQSCAAECG
jgi:hypothetical protein